MSEETRLIFYDQLNLAKRELDAVATRLEAGHRFSAKVILEISIARLQVIASKIKVPEES